MSSSSSELGGDGGRVVGEHPLSGLNSMSLEILDVGESLLLLLLLELSVKDGRRVEIGHLGRDGGRVRESAWSGDALAFLRERGGERGRRGSAGGWRGLRVRSLEI